jgi:hypothetical protein
LDPIASPGGGHVVRGFVFSNRLPGRTMEILTLTHARIRAGQGDVKGARRVLTAILQRSPDHIEARALLEELEGKTGAEAMPEREELLADPKATDERRLAERFRRSLGRRERVPDVRGRVRRLEAWLTRIRGRDLESG